jgi:hypothetical protein
MLATGEVLTVERINSETLQIQLPEEPAAWEPHIRAVKEAPDEYASVVVLEVEGEIQP